MTLNPGRGACGGQRVVCVEPYSPAALSGLQEGDRIIGLEDRLLFALGDPHDSSAIEREIEATWRARGSTPPAVTLTVIRARPLVVPKRDPSLPTLHSSQMPTHPTKGHFPIFKNVISSAATGMGMFASHQHMRNNTNRRLPRGMF